MPGFNIGGMGGNQPPNTIEPRRVHRWTFQTIGRGAGQFSTMELLVLKSATRPKFKFEDVKMEHDQETIYFAGKQSWEPIELTWYDIEQNPDVSAGIYQWLTSVVDLTSVNVQPPVNYKRQATLAMLTGMGAVSELWTLYGTWPQDFDWKELDYGNTELQTCTAKMRFDRAIRSNPG